jgi:PAS domain S-box-containing protein
MLPKDASDVPEFGGIGQARQWSNEERARAEGALRDSEERLRLVVESAKDYAIFTIDLDGLIQSWNAGAERMFGWTETEALGQHARMIFTPDDRARGAAEEEMEQAALCGRAADERWHVKRNGDRFYASGVLVPLRPDGILTGFAKIARDLTERKQLEDALRRAQDELEQRVRERTAELARTNSDLAAEVQERRAA